MPVQFLKKLRPAPWLLTAIDPDKPGTISKCCRNEKEAAAFVKRYRSEANLYYSVNPTRVMHKKSKKSDITKIVYVHADLDPLDGETADAAKKRYLKALDDCKPRPSAVVASGNGIQVLWRLKRPLPVEHASEVEACSASAMRALGGKAGTQDISRVLRLPGTINFPNATKRKAGRVKCRTKLLKQVDHSCDLSDFAHLPKQEANLPTVSKIKLDWAKVADYSDGGFALPANAPKKLKVLWHWSEDLDASLKKLNKRLSTNYASKSDVMMALAALLKALHWPMEKVAAALMDDRPCNGHVNKPEHDDEQKRRAVGRAIERAYGSKKPKALNTDGFRIVSASDIETRPVNWLWEKWLARGKLTMLAGMPGAGKSSLSIAIAAVVTKGGKMPDGSRIEQGDVLMYSDEEDPDDTIVPRFLAAGGDRARLHFVMGAFNAAEDIPELTEALKRYPNTKLVIFDPIVSVMDKRSGKSDNNVDVRNALRPVMRMGTEMGFAVLGITHFAKNSAGRDPVERVIGSIAFMAAARVGLVAAKSEDPAKPRMLAIAMSKIGKDSGGLQYTIKPKMMTQDDGSECEVWHVEWGLPCEGSARELLEYTEGAKANKKDAKAYLLEVLGANPVASTDAQTAMKEEGFSRRQISDAKQAAGILVYNEGGVWWWWAWL